MLTLSFRQPCMSVMTVPLSKTQVLEVVPGNLFRGLNSPNFISGEFSIKENGSGVLFSGTISDSDIVLPPFRSARPNAKIYYELGKQPKDENSFKVYIDNQGARIVFEDGVLITAVFDEEIVLEAKGYEIQGEGFWIGKETGPD